jgi:hypothetical protein
MNDTKKELFSLLKTIKGSGSFETSGIKKFTSPGLRIKGIGEIGLPLSPLQIGDIIQVSHKAPFGKGSKTITDTTVRSAWEIDAAALSFHNEDWQEFMEGIIKKIKAGLGIEDNSVVASLYKLLIYEQGDFFLPHKDSEKEPGMFGTLIIGLPSTHTGGELIIRFDGREKIIDFASPANNYKMPYIAFFADCDHEVKPITSGYRVCVVYNLLQSSGTQRLGLAQTSSQLKQMAALLKSLPNSTGEEPKAILLEHQYTPANFSWDSLKHHDKPRAELLLEAANQAGYFATLGLVTHYQMGELEDSSYDYGYRDRYRNRDSKGSGDGTMGEVYEEYTTIEHWGDGKIPALGKIDIGNDDLLSDYEIGKGTPIEEQEEGFTGNAGMTMEYWYHYGAVIFWPKNKHIDLLSIAAVPVRLKWLEYYYNHWDNRELNSLEYIKHIITRLTPDDLTNWQSTSSDFSIVATILSKLKNEKFIHDKCQALLTTVFSRIQIMNWVTLLQNYKPNLFMPIFEIVANRNDVYSLNHILGVIKSLSALSSSSLDTFLQHHIQHIPNYLDNFKLSKLTEPDRYEDKSTRKATIIAILEKVIELSQKREQDTAWVKSTVEAITKSLPRNYVNQILNVIVLRNSGTLVKHLKQICVMDLEGRTTVKPSPPPDWKRKLPNTKDDAAIWKILGPFLESPDLQVFEYRKSEAYRKQMESAINHVTVDLKMETVTKGMPYTLKITKTQAAYELKFKHWLEDMAFLEKINKAVI